MKKNILLCAAIMGLLFACTDTEIVEEVLVKPNTYDSKYYQNLRDYKNSDHQICFGWYAGYTSDGSPSGGHHFQGLPDSMDIVSLWSQIPSNNPEFAETNYWNEKYMPNAYREMWEMRQLKGTKIVKAIICRIASSGFPSTEAGIEAYAMYLVRMVLKNNLDGLDLDYEPEGDWLQNDNFTKFVKIIGRYLGPQSGTGKLLIVDFYNQVPPEETEPYVDYYIRQCYEVGSGSTLQTRYNQLSWCPPGKFIPTEQMGWHWENGGVRFTETDGGTVDSWGNPLYSVIGMARWNPTQGKKGGFGGYYFEYEYNTLRPAKQDIGDTENEPMPYYSLRRGIQEQNPAQHE